MQRQQAKAEAAGPRADERSRPLRVGPGARDRRAEDNVEVVPLPPKPQGCAR
jgi:hypothetical protein